MKFTLGKSIVEVDVDVARESHAAIKVPGFEECGCSYCRNWILQRKESYSPSGVRLLTDVGIKIRYETEVWDMPWDEGRRYCSGWYRFVGGIVCHSHEYVDFGGMELWVSQGLSYSVPCLVPEAASEIHFSKVIDWVLDEPADATPSVEAGREASPASGEPSFDGTDVVDLDCEDYE